MFKPIFFAMAALMAAGSVLAAPYRDEIAPYYPADQKTGFEQYKPLMVIRYNQNNVYYQLPLYNAVQKTLQVKPTAQFTFISKVPYTGQPEKDQALQQQARSNWMNVLQTVTDIGLPEKQMDVQFVQSNQVANNEILVYVQ